MNGSVFGIVIWWLCFFSSRRRHTRCALVTGVQTCALPIWTLVVGCEAGIRPPRVCLIKAGTTRRVTPGNRFFSGKQDRRDGREIGRASCRERVCQYV